MGWRGSDPNLELQLPTGPTAAEITGGALEKRYVFSFTGWAHKHCYRRSE